MRSFDPRAYFADRKTLPSTLYIIGELPPPEYKLITIVGSRKPSAYGVAVVKSIIRQLRDLPISIISGLALGIDGLVHRQALEGNIHTIAFPGSGIAEHVLYPATHRALAQSIVQAGGALCSEWKATPAAPWTFPVRNKIMAGIADLVLIIEADIDSGTMITARAASDLGVPLAAIPGNIDAPLSRGPNMLISEGAHCVTSGVDIMRMLGISPRNAAQQKVAIATDGHLVLTHLDTPLHRDQLLLRAGVPAQVLNTELTRLELYGMVTIDAQGFVRKSAS